MSEVMKPEKAAKVKRAVPFLWSHFSLFPVNKDLNGQLEGV